MPKRIVWLSRHPILQCQLAELQRLFGSDMILLPHPDPFRDAEDILRWYAEAQADEIVAVVPMTVMRHLIKAGLHPLYAKMERVPCSQQHDFTMYSPRGPRCLKFRGFKQVVDVRFEFKELSPPDKEVK